MNISPEGWMGIVGAILSLGMLAQRLLDKWNAPFQATPQPPPPPPVQADPRLTSLPQPPAMVAPPPYLQSPPPPPYRAVSAHDSQGECLGCAAMRVERIAEQKEIADLRKTVDRLQNEAVKISDFLLFKEEIKEERDEDRKVRAQIQRYFDRRAGAKEERERLERQHQAPLGGGKIGHGSGSDSNLP